MDYDLIIIGGGAAGFAAAIRANDLSKRTLIVNSELPIGGTCVNVGCMPTKYLLSATNLYHKITNSPFKSIKVSDVKIDFETLFKEKDNMVRKLREKNYTNVLNHLNNVEYIEGKAKFSSDHSILINDREFTSNKFIIATGASTFIPDIQGIRATDYLTNRTVLELKNRPDSMLIIGAGPAGVEFAQIFARLGTKVYITARSNRILKRMDPSISRGMEKYLSDEITILTKTTVQSICSKYNKKEITLLRDGKIQTIYVDKILITSGLKGNTDNLGNIDIKTDEKGFIIRNKFLQTSIPNIYTAGDVAGYPWLETVAAKEGYIAATNALEDKYETIDYSIIPSAVFTSPEIATVGMTEFDYVQKYGTCSCTTVTMDNIPKSYAINDSRGFILMVRDHRDNKIRGVHIIGFNASEIIHEAVFAIKQGLTVDDVINTVHIFPTLSEAIKVAAQSFSKDLSQMSCCIQ